jgi:hypothetical protein
MFFRPGDEAFINLHPFFLEIEGVPADYAVARQLPVIGSTLSDLLIANQNHNKPMKFATLSTAIIASKR